MPTYKIRLNVKHIEAGYVASWTDSGMQESNEFSLNLPLGQEEIADLRWYLEQYAQFPGAGDHAKAKKITAKFPVWGSALFKAVFGTDETKDVYRNLLAAVDQGQAGLITLGAIDPDVLVQPWEMMRDSKGVLALRGVTLRRQLKGSKPVEPYDFKLPLRVLLIVSRPTDVSFIDPRNSIPPVLDACEALGGLVEVEFCNPPTLPRLEEMISKARKENKPYHIVHFDGHGTYLPLTGIGALAFEKNDAKTDLVPARRFGDLIARLNIPLVLLEACRGSDLSDQPVFGSLAPALLDSGVGSVVAFSHAVHIQAARILVERFYKELTSGSSVGTALQEGRAAMLANPERYLHLGPKAETVELQDWFIPQLYQVGEDPVLIPKGARLPAGRRKPSPRPSPLGRGRLEGFPPEPMYKFHGRALELLELERAFRKHPAVVVSGMGGMGKTALAREAAGWWLRTGRFDKAVFSSFEQRAGVRNAVLAIGTKLEGEDFSRRSEDRLAEDGQWQTAVRLFHEQKALVVWDNFESTLEAFQEGEDELTSFSAAERLELQALYRDLTGEKPEGRLLVTCRPLSTGLPGIKEYALGGLKRPDSLHLLAAALDLKGISTERTGYERAEIDQLLDLLQDHPLSIELIAPHLKTLTPEQIRTDFASLLEKFTNLEAKEARNRGLLASLEFSKKRLSQEAQQALPWLGWFEGGVFERFLIDFAGLDEKVWERVRSELEATALLKVEDEILVNKRPYLRFHPTLSYAAQKEAAPDPEAAEGRFIQVYLAVMQLAEGALNGENPVQGMLLMQREEANLRRALACAFSRGMRYEGGRLADTLRVYLQMAGRNREREELTGWVQEHTPSDVLDVAVCNAIRQHAWTLFTQGKAQEAVGMVQELLSRLQREGLAEGSDPAFQMAVSNEYLGRILYNAGRADLALQPLQEAIHGFEQMEGEAARGNLAVGLGDLANAYMLLGRFEEALQANGRALAINRELKQEREVASDLARNASILMDAHQYEKSETRFKEALQAAQAAGDVTLQGLILQRQGGLYREQGQHAHAIELFRQAIALFQETINPAEEMRTCDLLASAEVKRGELDSAEAWYGRSRELAEKLHDRRQLAATAQNLGILYQTRAEATTETQERERWLDKALKSVEESLAIFLKEQNQLLAAASHFQLSVLHRLRGELDSAEENALKGLKISEELDHPEVYKDYHNLAEIARAKGEEARAQEWQAKFEAKRAELDRLEGRGERVDVAGLARHVQRLAQVCYQTRANQSTLPPEVAEALAQFRDFPAPYDQVGGFLQAVAERKPIPPLPEGLPPAIGIILKTLREAVNE